MLALPRRAQPSVCTIYGVSVCSMMLLLLHNRGCGCFPPHILPSRIREREAIRCAGKQGGQQRNLTDLRLRACSCDGLSTSRPAAAGRRRDETKLAGAKPPDPIQRGFQE